MAPSFPAGSEKVDSKDLFKILINSLFTFWNVIDIHFFSDNSVTMSVFEKEDFIASEQDTFLTVDTMGHHLRRL